MTIISDIFGRNLKNLRVSRNLTQAQLAEALNMAHRTLQGYEGGTRSPKLETVGEIADYFDIEASELFLSGLSGKQVSVIKDIARIASDLSNIPDYILEKTAQVSRENPHWDSVNAILEAAIEWEQEQSQKKKNKA